MPEDTGEAGRSSDEAGECHAERFVFAAPHLEALVDAPDFVVCGAGNCDDAATGGGGVFIAGQGQVSVEWCPAVDTFCSGL